MVATQRYPRESSGGEAVLPIGRRVHVTAVTTAPACRRIGDDARD